jgi:tRNA-Thr(GGU) m(6)t(6)A37 methyltransferase TsaA
MSDARTYSLKPVGFVESILKSRREAPMQGNEGAPDAWIRIVPSVARAVKGIAAGQEVYVITWLHQARRDVLRVHPRSERNRPLAGVFATRSPDRPNPLGLHRVKVLEVAGDRIKVGPLEAIDGTPVVDIKPILCP